MTEAEWLACENSEVMLEPLRHSGTASQRKLRLFACACARRVWHLLSDERSRSAVQVAERYADRPASEAERKAASAEVPCLYGNPDDVTDPENIRAFGSEAAACTVFGADDYPAVPTFAVTCAIAAARSVANALACAASSPLRMERVTAENVADRVFSDEQKVLAALMRDIFRNPFRPAPRLDPAWLTPEAIGLAQRIDDQRTFHRMPELAGALERAGCDNEDILCHWRQQGQIHVRGCWVVDLLLNKA
jgi:hypothetical protein